MLRVLGIRTLCHAPQRSLIVSTVISQTSLVAAGFYTTLPHVVNLVRYVSPVYWAFSGILKSTYRWNDTYQCISGDSVIGVNECFIEFHPGIDVIKRRGINVATYNDSTSNSTVLSSLMLVVLYLVLNVTVLSMLLYRVQCMKRQESPCGGTRSRAQGNGLDTLEEATH